MDDIVCEDCGRGFVCHICNTWRLTKPDHAEHDTAARVAGWTVWRGKGALILCPKHRQQRGIPPRVIPLA